MDIHNNLEKKLTIMLFLSLLRRDCDEDIA